MTTMVWNLLLKEDAWTGYKRFLSSDYAAIADGGCPVIYFTYFNTKGLEAVIPIMSKALDVQVLTMCSI